MIGLFAVNGERLSFSKSSSNCSVAPANNAVSANLFASSSFSSSMSRLMISI